jgi:hypothetical protein
MTLLVNIEDDCNTQQIVGRNRDRSDNGGDLIVVVSEGKRRRIGFARRTVVAGGLLPGWTAATSPVRMDLTIGEERTADDQGNTIRLPL